jgi:dolichyl-diphosphooligosaccharide--protein glycosyltransferase
MTAKEIHPLASAVVAFLRVTALTVACYLAYDIRMYAVREYGRIIHEFDPWFNFRATQYLADNGWAKFSKWFDYMSWYPLGRPVGTTIYPGMQITAVTIWKTLGALGTGFEMSLNDVCVFFPAWFGAVATLLTGLLTAECSGDRNAGVVASLVMSIVPAHTMRSVAGGYDNESLAVTAMVLTFFVWVRSLRTPKSWPIGALAGLAYVYMVAAWGGYTFVLNMVGLHAAALVLAGKFDSSAHKAYSLFWIVGTLGAVQFPVVGLAPVKSMEQLGPALVFVGYQVIEVTERLIESQAAKSGGGLGEHRKWRIRLRCYAAAGACLLAAVAALGPTGWFGPLSVRVRGLFIKHTKTGNPLVDSVAEHQPGSPDAYRRYLHFPFYVAPVGFAVACFQYLESKSAAALFLPLYGVVAYYFANRMVRLIIFLGPIASCLSGVAVGHLMEQVAGNLRWFAENAGGEAGGDDRLGEADAKKSSAKKNAASAASAAAAAAAKGSGKRSSKKRARFAGNDDETGGIFERTLMPVKTLYRDRRFRAIRIVVASFALFSGATRARSFWAYSHEIAQGMSQPSVMFKGQLNDGRTIIVKDYVEAYHWLRDNTPEDARVMAWWDYGYQIAGIANRTSIADGNTWNHEHIANLARTMTATEEKAHRVIRHLADYVLVWSGGGADDMAKSPHLFRIGKSIGHVTGTVDMHEIQSKFGVDQYGRPTPLMAESLLYKLVSFQGSVSSARFEEVYTSKYRKVRIYKVVNVSEKSKAWAADPANRLCDAPGSWYCPGQYPPALAKFTGIIKPAYSMPAFAKKQIEEREKQAREVQRLADRAAAAAANAKSEAEL